MSDERQQRVVSPTLELAGPAGRVRGRQACSETRRSTQGGNDHECQHRLSTMFATTSPDKPSLRCSRLANVIARDPLTEAIERAASATAAACEAQTSAAEALERAARAHAQAADAHQTAADADARYGCNSAAPRHRRAAAMARADVRVVGGAAQEARAMARRLNLDSSPARRDRGGTGR